MNFLTFISIVGCIIMVISIISLHVSKITDNTLNAKIDQKHREYEAGLKGLIMQQEKLIENLKNTIKELENTED